jgi:hypothetical protein
MSGSGPRIRATEAAAALLARRRRPVLPDEENSGQLAFDLAA